MRGLQGGPAEPCDPHNLYRQLSRPLKKHSISGFQIYQVTIFKINTERSIMEKELFSLKRERFDLMRYRTVDLTPTGFFCSAVRPQETH